MAVVLEMVEEEEELEMEMVGGGDGCGWTLSGARTPSICLPHVLYVCATNG